MMSRMLHCAIIIFVAKLFLVNTILCSMNYSIVIFYPKFHSIEDEINLHRFIVQSKFSIILFFTIYY